jgi:hypothetical protein
MSEVADYAKIVFEFGFDIDGLEQIERRFDSVCFHRLTEEKDHLKIYCRSDVNFDDMVFSDGIDCTMWVKGRIRPVPVSSADFEDEDDRVRSLKNRHRIEQRLEIDEMSPKQWHKLSLWSGVGDDGEFRIENMLLVVTEMPEAEEQGETNLSTITAQYAYAGENLSIKSDELVLNPTTGIIGSGQTGKAPYPVPTIVLMRDGDGNYMQTEDGKYIDLQDVF